MEGGDVEVTMLVKDGPRYSSFSTQWPPSIALISGGVGG